MKNSYFFKILWLKFKLRSISRAKIREVDKANFMKAADLRDEEKKLLKEIKELKKIMYN